jgi:hypothetical protein
MTCERYYDLADEAVLQGAKLAGQRRKQRQAASLGEPAGSGSRSPVAPGESQSSDERGDLALPPAASARQLSPRDAEGRELN